MGIEVVIQKNYQGETWTNGYLVDAADVTAGQAFVSILVNAERDIHFEAINFEKALVRTTEPNDNNFLVIPLSGVGNRTLLTDLLPLWNIVRAEFPTFQGRPYYKQYRGCLQESEVDYLTIEPSALTVINDALAGLAGLLVSDTGAPLGDGLARSRVFIRQLRRGPRRRARPVI